MIGAVATLLSRADTPLDLRTMLGQAAAGLAAAEQHLRMLQQVVRIETKDTPVGPALDLERSAAAARG